MAEKIPREPREKSPLVRALACCAHACTRGQLDVRLCARPIHATREAHSVRAITMHAPVCGLACPSASGCARYPLKDVHRPWEACTILGQHAIVPRLTCPNLCAKSSHHHLVNYSLVMSVNRRVASHHVGQLFLPLSLQIRAT